MAAARPPPTGPPAAAPGRDRAERRRPPPAGAGPAAGAVAGPAAPGLAAAADDRAGRAGAAGLPLPADAGQRRSRSRTTTRTPATTRCEAFLHSEWIGFGNFEALFADPAFWDALRNTLAITAFQLVFFFPLPIALAILLNSVLSGQAARRSSRAWSTCRTSSAGCWSSRSSCRCSAAPGCSPRSCAQAGLEPWNIMTNPDTFIVLVTAEAVWKDVGWGTIVFLAALSTIDQNLYEAAAADGAGRWRRLWHITLPGLRPVIVLLLILRLGDALIGRLRAVHPAARRGRPAGRRGARHVRLLPRHRHRSSTASAPRPACSRPWSGWC